MKRLTLSLLAVTLMFLAPEWTKAERFEAIPGAITDTVTGLMWYSRPCEIHGYWQDGESFTENFIHVGYEDWRQPTIQELQDLFEVISPGGPIFDGIMDYYWTSTESIKFSTADSSISYDPNDHHWIWPVRTAFIPSPEFPDDTQAPTGAVHAYDNVIWSPNNKMVTVTLEGYVKDELSMVRDGEGIGVSEAYLLIGSTEEIILRDSTTDLLNGDGKFSVNIQVKAVKGAEYVVELYASDTESADDGGPNSGLVDSTFIRVPHDMSD